MPGFTAGSQGEDVPGRDERARPGAAHQGGTDPAGTHPVSGGLDNVIPTASFWVGPFPYLTPQPKHPNISRGTFTEAMSRFPAGVTIVTTTDRDGRPRGFTASAFAALSAEPPLVLVCLDNSARCRDAFMTARLFAISILRPTHREVALRFASKQDDKFSGGEISVDHRGLARLADALACLTCEFHERVAAGDHTILVGRVVEATIGHGEPAVYFNRGFWRLSGAETRPEER
ncbi:MAG TPA: flavin reductase family protein [Streptosporangiaceae bacterium]|nr:flavin reductase family protein [Streptosporangiaceae bacterium]